jgi:AcrR family transcriptional regulator
MASWTLARLARAERREQFGEFSQQPRAGDGVGVVPRIHDLPVPDCYDHGEPLRERLTCLGELAVKLVFDNPDPGVGGVVDDDIAQPLVPPDRGAGPEPGAQFLPGRTGGAEEAPAMTGSRPLRADGRRNRQRLLQAATSAFAAEGLSVPLDEIARRAGVGPGTLYRHFPTKDALFEAVLHDRLRRLADDAQALRHAEDPAAALLDFIGRLTAEAAPKRDLADALASGGAELNAALTATAARLRNEIGHLLTRAQHTGAIRDDITTADLMALITGIIAALRPGPGDQANPQRTMAVLRDGLRVAPA